MLYINNALKRWEKDDRYIRKQETLSLYYILVNLFNFSYSLEDFLKIFLNKSKYDEGNNSK